MCRPKIMVDIIVPVYAISTRIIFVYLKHETNNFIASNKTKAWRTII